MNTAFVENPDRLEVTGRVREELIDLMEIDRYSWDERGTLTLRGRLSGPADALYRAIRTRMERLGFTPFLRHDATGDELVAMPGVSHSTRNEFSTRIRPTSVCHSFTLVWLCCSPPWSWPQSVQPAWGLIAPRQ